MKVTIEREIYEKLMFYVRKADKEISGIGKAYRYEDSIVVYDAILSDCINSATQTDIDELSMAKSMVELDIQSDEYLVWWHSHVNMGTTLSGTDVATTKQIGSNGACVSLVLNKKGEVNSAVMFNLDSYGFNGLPPMFLNDVPVDVGEYFDEDTLAELEQDFKDKYKVKAYKPDFRIEDKKPEPVDNSMEQNLIKDFYLSNYPKDMILSPWLDFTIDYKPIVDLMLMPSHVKEEFTQYYFLEHGDMPKNDTVLEFWVEEFLDNSYGKDPDMFGDIQ